MSHTAHRHEPHRFASSRSIVPGSLNGPLSTRRDAELTEGGSFGALPAASLRRARRVAGIALARLDGANALDDARATSSREARARRCDARGVSGRRGENITARELPGASTREDRSRSSAGPSRCAYTENNYMITQLFDAVVGARDVLDRAWLSPCQRLADVLIARLTFIVLNVRLTAVTLDEIGDLIEAKMKRIVQRGVPTLVLRIRVGAVSYEKLDATSLTILSRDNERSVAHLVSSINRHALCEERLHLTIPSVASVRKQISNF